MSKLNIFTEFDKLEKQKEWQEAIIEIEKIIEKHPNNEEGFIRVVYFLHNYILEEYNHTDLQSEFEIKLLKYFHLWKEKFLDNSNFLFFIWIIIHIAEWYFWLDDDPKKIEDRLSFKMQKRASILEPDNKLFEWSYLLSFWDKQQSKDLWKQVLGDTEKNYVGWLENKWFPWNYILNQIQKSVI